MAISLENAHRMMAITSTPELKESDFGFFRNHIGSFVEWLVDKAIEDLVSLGVDRDLAHSMLNTISHLSSMKGANDLFDFGVSQSLLESLDEGDNA